MKLYLVRHTRVDMPSGICYGQTDVPLAASFETESESVRSRLSKIQFDAVFCSPLSRCIKLGSFLAYQFQLDDRLKELNFGEWEGRTWDTIFESETGQKWFGDYLNEACPNGESYQQMLYRVENFIADLPETDGNILVITHAGVIRAFRVLLKNWPVKKAFDKPVAYGQITIIEKR
ncbi:alpha-ribazole phosphatase [Proteiniphilum acetatigenes]|uniref:alpha-ribazole phosphatase n=1 Tax=Proteiniphilum acetatigenes TaxID=294710 RepID=UPI00037BDD51|nr:alpha-ribazole phosphatase [Proteiniphilum acetatigenes]SFK41499.1 alpha-ribazole phosphatase [Porphyromonadaceae bacterium KH3CP3RA]